MLSKSANRQTNQLNNLQVDLELEHYQLVALASGHDQPQIVYGWHDLPTDQWHKKASLIPGAMNT